MPPITDAELDTWFTYHPPSKVQQEQYQALRDGARQFAQIIKDNTPPSPDQTTAIRKLREAVMTANAAIACAGR